MKGIDVITVCPLCDAEGKTNPILLRTHTETVDEANSIIHVDGYECGGGHTHEAIRDAVRAAYDIRGVSFNIGEELHAKV